jgi:hypothetical protein
VWGSLRIDITPAFLHRSALSRTSCSIRVSHPCPAPTS